MRWLESITDSMGMNLSTVSRRQWRTEEPGVLESMGLQTVGQDFSDRTTITIRSDHAAQRRSPDVFPAKSSVSFLTNK